MIPIKILCGCGQKYAFDCEPSGGRVSGAVACPTCGADGTSVANEIIAEHQAPLAIRGVEPVRPGTVHPFPGRQVSSAQITKKPNRYPIIVASVLIVLVLVAAVGLVVHRPHKSKEIVGQFVAAESGELPRTWEELNAWYTEPPRGQNAATFFAEGLEGLRFEGASSLPLVGKGKLSPLGVPLSGPMKSGIAVLLNANREALQRFDEGSSYERSRYPVDLTLGFESLLPHLLNFRRAMQLEELAAMLHAEEQNGFQASRDLHVAVALARSLEAEPQLSSQNTRASAIVIAVNALEQTLNRVSLPADASISLLSDLRKMSACDEEGDGFNRAFAAERLDALAILARPNDLLSKLSGPRPQLPMPAEDCKAWVAALTKADKIKEQQQFYAQTFEALMAARKQPFPGRLQSDELIRQKTSEAADKQLGIARLLMPALTGRALREAAWVAQGRLAQAAMALQHFRMQHENRFPATLAELTPTDPALLPIDPFDGQPLRYRKAGRGYVLYSIGADKKDDAGDRTRDIVFAVIAPPRVAP